MGHPYRFVIVCAIRLRQRTDASVAKEIPARQTGRVFGKGVLPIIAAIAIGALFGGNRVLRSATIIERNKTYALAFLRLGVTKH
jgi:ABC-type dipeptide/oligopeptide/nickel transport system permease subunit